MSSFSSLPPGIFTSDSPEREKAIEKEQAEEKTENYEKSGTEFPDCEESPNSEKETEESEETQESEWTREVYEEENNVSEKAQSEAEISEYYGSESAADTAEPHEEENEDIEDSDETEGRKNHASSQEQEDPSDETEASESDEREDAEDDISDDREYVEPEHKKSVLYRIFASVILAAQAASGVYLIYRAVDLGMLPLRYIIAVGAVILALVSLIFIGLFLTEKRWKRIISVILCLAVTASSCAGIWYVNQTASFKKKAFGTAVKHTEMTTYLVLVRKGRYTKKEQLKNRAVETGPESDTQNTALEKLNKAVSVKNVPVTGYDVLDSDLMKDRTDAILIEDSASSILDETDKGFSSKTSVLMKIKVPRSTASGAEYTGNGSTFTVFVSGSDSRGGVKETARSDVDMLLTVNPKNRQVLMTSIPRDSFVTIHGKNAKDKLTHAGLLGINTLTATVKDFMKVDIDYYLKVNFTSVTTLVDELGGIDIYSDQNIKLWTFPVYHNKPLSKGWHHMDGKTALAFARERHSYESGDRHRAENQQAVLKAIAGKLMSGKTLTNYANILKSISSMFVTNMPDSLISDLVSQQLSQGGAWKFSSYVIDCTETMRTGGYFMPTRKLYYAIPVPSSVKKARKQINDVKGDSSSASYNSSDSAVSDSSKAASSSSSSSSSGSSTNSSSGTQNSTDSSSDAGTDDENTTKPITQQEAAI